VFDSDVPVEAAKHQVIRCDACGRHRTGRLIRVWPPEATICPNCSEVARRVWNVEFGKLCPEREPA
jgi:formylmethanofuran dehydrogenase subunit E